MCRIFLFSEAIKAGAVRKESPVAFVCLELLPIIAQSPGSIKEMEKKKKNPAQKEECSSKDNLSIHWSLRRGSYRPGTWIGTRDATLEGPDIILPSWFLWQLAMEPDLRAVWKITQLGRQMGGLGPN